MRNQIREALAENLARGKGERNFTEVVNAEFDRAGLSRLKPYQIANIYTTNTATAFAAGQMARMLEVQEDFPFWQFSAVMDSRTRPAHAALHGKIFRVGDFTFYPPLDFQCRCTAKLLTARQAGKHPRTAMPDADQRNELYAKAGKPEFAGNKQGNYLAWLANEYKEADPATRKLIDQATEAMRQEMKRLGKDSPKRSRQIIPEKAEISPIPEALAADGAFVNGAKIAYNKAFFAMINKDKPVGLVINSKGGAYYSPSEQKVYLTNGDRAKASVWYRERVVYHEFGHAIDFQRNLRGSERIGSMLKEWQRALGKKSTYKEYGWHRDAEGHLTIGYYPVQMSRIAYVSQKLDRIYYRIGRMSDATFKRLGITRDDVLEQIAATQDTIKAINVRYGWGHKTAYFRRPGMKETEFIAHCFENRFAGNRVFQKYLPDLYQAMVDYIKEQE